MAKKFDTNPLDPDFPKKVMDTQEELQTVTLPKNKVRRTRKYSEPVETEEKTQKFDQADFESYESAFGNSENQPAPYQTRALYSEEESKKKTHNIGSISLPENVLTALPYIPFAYIGLIAGIIELIFIPKSEPKVRYHAAQGLAAQIGVWIILTVLGFFSWTDVGTAASGIFSVVTTIMLIIFAVKAWQGKPIHIETVQDLTDWLEEKISPQK